MYFDVHTFLYTFPYIHYTQLYIFFSSSFYIPKINPFLIYIFFLCYFLFIPTYPHNIF